VHARNYICLFFVLPFVTINPKAQIW
jgi:hypothetical protein